MYVIRTQKLALYLMKKGFELIRTDDNRDNLQYKIFLFNDTPVLREMVKQYKRLNSKIGIKEV